MYKNAFEKYLDIANFILQNIPQIQNINLISHMHKFSYLLAYKNVTQRTLKRTAHILIMAQQELSLTLTVLQLFK